MKMYFPSNRELKDAIITALEELGGEAKVQDIDKKVIEILNLPDEIVTLEDDTSTGTKLSYRLRWCRTELKDKKIEKVIKGTWKLL